MSDDERLVTAKFQVPAQEVEAGLNGHLILKAHLHAASSESIQHTEGIKESVEQLRDEVHTEYESITNELMTKVGYKLQVNNQEVASYTLELEDAGDLVRMNYGNDNVVIVPGHDAVPFERGTIINVRQVGEGSTTIEPAEGVDLNSPTGENATDGTDFGVALVKVGDYEWDLVKGFKGVPAPEVNDFVEEVEGYFTRLEDEIENAERQVEVLQRTIAQAREQLSSELSDLETWISSISDQNSDQNDELNDIKQDLLEAITDSSFVNKREAAYPGWQELPGGLVFQWGKAGDNPGGWANDGGYHTFAKEFGLECLVVVTTPIFQGNNGSRNMYVRDWDKSGFSWYAQNDERPFVFLAVGI